MPLIIQEVKVRGYCSTLCAHNVLLSLCCVAGVALVASPAFTREGTKSAGWKVLAATIVPPLGGGTQAW